MKRTILAICMLLSLQGFSQKASLVVQTGHYKDITCLEFSPDSRLVASGGEDGALLLYDAGTVLQMASYTFFDGQLRQVGFTADSKKVMGLSNGQTNGLILFALIDVSKNDTVYTIRYDEEERMDPSDFRISYDNKLLGFRNGSDFYFYDLASGKFLYKIQLEEKVQTTEFWQFTHDNKRIICEDEEAGNILLVDLASKSVVKTIPGEVTHMGKSSVEIGSLSADDRYYSRCREPEKWYKYDLVAGNLLSETTPEKEEYSSPSDCHLSADGNTVMVNDLGLLLFFDVASGKKIRTIDHNELGAERTAISRDGKKIVLAVYNSGHDIHSKNTTSDLVFVDVASGRITGHFTGTPMRPSRVTFSNNSRNVAIASNMPYKVWNLQTADGVKSAPEDSWLDESNLMTMEFSPDDQVLFMPDEERPDLVNLPTLEMKEYNDHFYYRFRPDKAGGTNKWICPDHQFENVIIGDGLYKMASGEFTCVFKEKDGPYEPRREFTPDGKYAVMFSENRAQKGGVMVYVYSTGDCKKVAEYEIPVMNSNEYDDYNDKNHVFAHDSKRIAIINKDYTLFDLLTGKILVHKQIYRKEEGGFWDDCDPNGLSFSPDDLQIAIANDNNEIAIIETATGKLLHILKGHLDEVNSVSYSPDGKRLVSSGEDGRVILWDPEKGTQVATFIGLDTADYIVTTPDNYYMSTKKGLKGVGFRVGNKMYPVEQFDLRQNRPDTVLQRIGMASSFLIKMYRMAWLKRLKHAGFTPEMLSADFHVPDMEIPGKLDLPLTTDGDHLKFRVKMKDSLYALGKFNVYVNNVPVYGSRGFDLRNSKVKSYDTEVDLLLSAGKNKVEVSVINEKGAESVRETFDVLCNKPVVKPDLYVLAIGVSEYADAIHNLKFAAKDASDFVNVLKDGNAGFGNVYTRLVTNADATLENVSSLRSFFAKSKPDDEVIVYFSGHGLLDDKLDYYLALNKVNFNVPSRGGLPYEMLESFIDSVPSRNRIVFIDACHSGEVDKEDLEVEHKPNSQVTANSRSGNISVKPKAGLKNSFDYMNALFSDIQKGSGASVISAAGGLEFALESKDWSNGVFTYSILNGLKNKDADANKDGVIRLSELKTYISDEVFLLTDGKQHPTMRKENAGNDAVIYKK